MNELSRLLLLTDFSEGARAALHHATRLCRRSSAVMEVLHVVDDHDLDVLADALRQDRESTLAQIISDARRQLEDWVGDRADKLTAELRVVAGQPLDQVLERVRDFNADLVVMGLLGEKSESKTLGVGDLAAKLIRNSPAQVLAVHPNHASSFDHVAVCVDFSDNSMEALRQAVELARLEEARLDVLHVYNPPWRRLHYKAPTPEMDSSFQKSYKTALNQKIRGFARVPDELPHDFYLRENSSPGHGISEFAQERGVDLIVMGVKGHSNLKYMLIGSTAERVLRRLPCSALAIRPLG